MVKYIANVEFKDRYTWEIIPKGTELELTEERAEEIINVLGEEALIKEGENKSQGDVKEDIEEALIKEGENRSPGDAKEDVKEVE
jgi:hypothetical protein